MIKLLLVVTALVSWWLYSNPATVVLMIKGTSITMPLWLTLIGVVVATLVSWVLIRWFAVLISLPTHWRAHHQIKRHEEAQSRLLTGLAHFVQYDFAKAHKRFAHKTQTQDTAAIAPQLALQSAIELGDVVKAQAIMTDLDTSLIDANHVKLYECQLNVLQSNWSAAHRGYLDTQSVPFWKTTHGAQIAGHILVAAKDWNGFYGLMNQVSEPIRPYLNHLLPELTLYARLLESALTVEGLNAEWKRLPKFAQQQQTLLLLYAERQRLLGAFDSALQTLFGAIKQDPTSELINAYFAIALEAKDSKAPQKLQKLLGTHPDNAVLHAAIGQLFFAEGRLDEAKQHFRKANEHHPMPSYHGMLGLVYEQLGQPQSAASHFRQAAIRLLSDEFVFGYQS